MDKLTKDQKDEYATSFAALALYDGGVSYLRRFDFCAGGIVTCSERVAVSILTFPRDISS